jgi:hypothetical protein
MEMFRGRSLAFYRRYRRHTRNRSERGGAGAMNLHRAISFPYGAAFP